MSDGNPSRVPGFHSNVSTDGWVTQRDRRRLGRVPSPPLPTATTRWRCTQCGNLTRFDVTRRSRVREFLHVDLAGEPAVEEREVLQEVVDSVRCRWCAGVDTVKLVPRPA